MVATGLDGRIYAYGASGGSAAYGKWPTAEAYDPSTGAWSALPDLHYLHGHGGAGTVGADGRLYALGGTCCTPRLERQAEAYGPAIKLRTRGGHAGATDVLTGTNFAGRATVTVTWGSSYMGTVLATGRDEREGRADGTDHVYGAADGHAGQLLGGRDG